MKYRTVPSNEEATDIIIATFVENVIKAQSDSLVYINHLIYSNPKISAIEMLAKVNALILDDSKSE